VRQSNQIKITIGLGTLLFSLSTFASCPPIPSGWYLDANGGVSKLSSVSFGSGSSIGTNGFAWNVNGGYKFNPFFGAELGYSRYGKVKIRNSAGTLAAQSTYYSYDAAAKAILPMMDTGFEFFAKLGFARLSASTSISNPAAASGLTITSGSTNATSLYIGAGADYLVSPNVPIIAQWMRARGTNQTGNMDLLSLGVGYIFG